VETLESPNSKKPKMTPASENGSKREKGAELQRVAAGNWQNGL
jgi:hypothetical protein